MSDEWPGSDDGLRALARQFERFAEVECGESPLYRRLAGGIARDPDLLRIAAHGDHGPKPNLFLAAVHDLLLDGVRDPLAAFYPSMQPEAAPAADAVPAFRAFCLAYRDQIEARLDSRRVQTNEVARCGVLLPGFAAVARRAGDAPLLLVEVGTSAGLLLRWDRYGYDYGDGRRCGADDRDVVISCEVRGAHLPPIPDALPVVGARVGIDLHPLDLNDEDDARWLKALVWPDQPERLERLRRAVAVARRQPVTIVAGDALAALPDVLADLPSDGVLCLFHAHTLNQFSSEDRRRYVDLLAAHSRQRDLYDLSLEALGGHPMMELRHFGHGEVVEQVALARYEPHGRWIEWLSSPA